MPKNPVLFPDKFILDGSVSDSGIGALEIAVNNLSVASKFGAMRQAHAIRVGGLGSIKNQNRGMPTLNSLLPIRSVGKYVTPPTEPSGTNGYFLGGYFISNGPKSDLSIDRFTFAANTCVSIGNFFVPHRYCFTFANKSFGYLAVLSSFYRLAFQSELFSSLGAVLFPARYIGASLKTSSRGYACSGTSSEGGGTTFSSTDRFSFAGEVCVAIATAVQARSAGFGFGNKFNGYLAGGYNNGVGPGIANNIERFSYASETVVGISSTLATGSKMQIGSWIPSSSFAAYLMSGFSYARFPDPVNSAFKTFATKTIDKFTYIGETVGVLGTSLTHGVGYCASVGNATRVVLGGGLRHFDAYETQASHQQTDQIIGLTFATETVEYLAATLSNARYSLSATDNSNL